MTEPNTLNVLGVLSTYSITFFRFKAASLIVTYILENVVRQFTLLVVGSNIRPYLFESRESIYLLYKW